MLWTDYCKIKEQISIIIKSVKRLRQVLKYGTEDAIEMEATFLQFNYQILVYLKKKHCDTFIDAGILKLENEARELLREAYSLS